MRQHDSKAASAEEKGREGGSRTCATSAAATHLASCRSIAESFAATQAIKQAVTSCCRQQGSRARRRTGLRKFVCLFYISRSPKGVAFQLNLQTPNLDACLVPSIEHNLTGATCSPNGFSQDVMTEDQTHDPPNRRQRLRPFSHSDLLRRRTFYTHYWSSHQGTSS